MTTDEAWAEALILHRTLGERAPAYIAERIAMLARVGNVAGVTRWREIANNVDELGSFGADAQPLGSA